MKNEFILRKWMLFVVVVGWAVPCCIPVFSAPLYWDGDIAGGLQLGNNTWDNNTTPAWSSSAGGSNPLLNWTNGNDDALFIVGGQSTAMINGTVAANSVSVSGGANLYITNGTLVVGVGGMNNLANNDNFLVFSSLNLSGNQTWSLGRGLSVYGSLGGSGNVLKTGTATLRLAGSNAYTGSMSVSTGATLLLDYSLQDNNKLDDASALILSGGTVTMSGGLHLEAVGSVSIAGGGSTVSSSGGAALLKMNTINRVAGSGGTLTFGADNIASTTSTNVNGLLGGWATRTAGWAVNANGSVEGNIINNYGNADNDPASWTAIENVSISGALTSAVTNKTINSMRFAGASLIDLNGATITLASGGLMGANVTPTVTNGYLKSGMASGELFAHALNGANTTVAAGIVDGIAPTILVKAGANTLILTAANTYSGATYVNAGTLQVGAGGISGDLGNSSNLVVQYGTTLSFNRSDTASWTGALAGAGTVQNISTGLVILTVISNSTIGTFGTTGSGILALQGDSSTSTVTSSFSPGTAGGTIVVNGGNWIDTGSLSVSRNATFNQAGGTLVVQGQVVGYGNGGQGQFIFSGGTFRGTYTGQASLRGSSIIASNSANVYFAGNDVRIGSDGTSGTWSLYSNATVTAAALQLVNGVTAGTINLAGGTLVVQGTLSSQVDATNIFNFTGGALAVFSLNACLPESTLTNSGGILAPGTIGVAGKSTITSNYVVNSSNAALAVDIGGTTQATAFTNAGNYYDFVSLPGNATLGGRLDVNLINGFVPASSNKFDVLTAGGTLSGTYTNIMVFAGTNRVFAADGFSTFAVTNVGGKTSEIYAYQLNEWASSTGGLWTTAGNWTMVEPNGPMYGACFGANIVAPANISLTASRTVRGILFTNINSCAVSGTNMLTLDAAGSSITSVNVTVLNGNHTISVPMVLNSPMNVSVNSASSTLLLSGGIGGNADLTKTGSGVLTLTGVNTYGGALTLNGGIINMQAGSSVNSSLAIAAGTVLNMSNTILRIEGGMTLAAGGQLNFMRKSTGILYLRKGVAGGVIDTTNEVNTAIADGRITKDGMATNRLEFIVAEEMLSGTNYIKTILNPPPAGTLIKVK